MVATAVFSIAVAIAVFFIAVLGLLVGAIVLAVAIVAALIITAGVVVALVVAAAIVFAVPIALFVGVTAMLVSTVIAVGVRPPRVRPALVRAVRRVAALLTTRSRRRGRPSRAARPSAPAALPIAPPERLAEPGRLSAQESAAFASHPVAELEHV